MEEFSNLILPICTEPLELLELGRTPLGFSGFGTLSRTYESIPKRPHEAFFYESMFASISVSGLEVCRQDNVCVDPISFDEKETAICDMDDGSPLYTFENCQGDLKAICLYGVASYYRNTTDTITNYVKCNDGSFFANVNYFSEWIQRTMNAS
ncbi:uncharacterized protein LOC142348520 [Convolutriloba macropyga]|uniref:uncharacterized protein LOC142348520 n=1 Tax=Convolutriloba macropyga TaxID=536237 RepID=UPI003F528168